MRERKRRIRGDISKVILFTGAVFGANVAAAVTAGYSDNLCTGSVTSAHMLYETTWTPPYPAKVLWQPDLTGPQVEFTMSFKCKDGQSSTKTSIRGANTWLSSIDQYMYYQTNYMLYYSRQPQPYVTLNADGSLTFGNGVSPGTAGTYPYSTVVSAARVNQDVSGFINSFWWDRAYRDTFPWAVQTWSTPQEAQSALDALKQYNPNDETIYNINERLYPAFPWKNNSDDRPNDSQSAGVAGTPRPMIRVIYKGPKGTLLKDGTAPRYEATVYCFPGQGDNDLFNRPVIVSDAFDPVNARSAWTIYSEEKTSRLLSVYNPTGIPGANGYNSPRALGYDVFFVDFSQGGGNMLINAALYLKVVEWMHARTQKPIIVGGPSMGGQIPRLAMLYSIPENNIANGAGVVGKDLAPRVKGYLSIDSPHQGASISASFQQTIYSVSQDSRVNTLADVMGEGNSAIDGWMQLSVPAAHQMLYSHYYPSLGGPSSAAHNGFYDFLKRLGAGKSLGDARGYRKDMAKSAIAYSNFNPPMWSLDETKTQVVGKLEIVNLNISVNGVPLKLSWNLFAGGAANDVWGNQHELEPGSVIKDECWSPYNKKSQKFSYPITSNYEHYAGTFMPIQSVLDLAGFDPLHPPTKNEKEIAAYSPFDAVFYMRDNYNDYARVKDPSYTGPVSVTPDDSRYEHIVFDDQCMTAIMRGLKAIEATPSAKTITGPIAPPVVKMFTLMGSATLTSQAPAVKIPFGFGSRTGGYDQSYPAFLPNEYYSNLSDGLSNLYEGKFDADLFNDALVVQGHKGTPNIVFKNDNDSYVLTPRKITYPEMSETAKISVGDFNGDEFDDILTLGNAGQNEILVDYSNWDGTFTLKRQLAADFVNAAMLPEVKVITGDFNNDRKADIVLIGGNDWNNIRVAWSNGDGTFRFQNFTAPLYFNDHVTAKGARVMVGTFQAPDQMGIAVVYGNRIEVVSLNNGLWDSDAQIGTTALNFSSWMADPTATVITGDFNGDGRTDIALAGGKGWSSIPLALSTGNGNFSVTNAGVGSFGSWASSPNVQISIADPDRDGKADIVLTGGIGWTTVPVAYSNGNGTFDVRNDAGGDLAILSQQKGTKKVTNSLSVSR